MKILALEFSSSQRSVAVVSGVRRVEERDAPSGSARGKTGTGFTGHSALMVSEVVETASGNLVKPMGMVEEALQQAGLEREQIECVAVGLGPGSYTGVRVAIALAQGWQLANGVKLVGVSSALGMAAQSQREGLTGRISVVVDAQRGEFYLAAYEIGETGLREVEPLRLVTKSLVQERARGGERLMGPEVTQWFEGGRLIYPLAATLGWLALEREDFVAGAKLEPIYLREAKFVKAPPARILS